jgi:hypothetical protein
MSTRLMQYLQSRVFLESYTDTREDFHRRRMNIVHLVVAQNPERSSQLGVEQWDHVPQEVGEV